MHTSSILGKVTFLAMLCALWTPFKTDADGTLDEYASLRPTLTMCFTCHGENGVSTQSQYPILAGQHLYYIYVQLKDYKSGLRASPIMGPMVASLEKEQMQSIAKYFSEQRWPERDASVDAKVENVGRTVISSGQCVACHLGDFEGNSRVPRLAGQHADYLDKTMRDFKTKARANAPDKGTLLASFSDEEIRAVSDYLATLKVVD